MSVVEATGGARPATMIPLSPAPRNHRCPLTPGYRIWILANWARMLVRKPRHALSGSAPGLRGTLRPIPMQPILNASTTPHDVVATLRREDLAQQVVAGFLADGALFTAGCRYLAHGLQARPVMPFLKPGHVGADAGGASFNASVPLPPQTMALKAMTRMSCSEWRRALPARGSARSPNTSASSLMVSCPPRRDSLDAILPDTSIFHMR